MITNTQVNVSVAVGGGSPNLGVDWSLVCGGSPNSIETTNVCGTLNPVHVGSNIKMNYTAPAFVPVGGTVTLTARATGDPSVSASIALNIVPPSIAMTWTTGNVPPDAMAASGLQQLAATVSNDPSAGGVNWTVTCGSSSCGSFNPTQTASGSAVTTYTAPSTVPAGGTVTVTATSVYDKTRSVSATIRIMPITVALSISRSTVPAGGPATLTATVTWDAFGAGVNWPAPLCGAGACGTVTSIICSTGIVAPTYTTTCTATYTAPPIPAGVSTLQVTVTATSSHDPSKSGTVNVTIGPPPPISVSVAAASGTLQVNGSTILTASVANDYSDAGVNWLCSPGTCNPASSTSLPFTTTFTAPNSIPSTNPVTVTATSIAAPATDPTRSGSATIALVPAIAVTLAATNPTAITAGVAATFSATVTNDISPGGVNWTANCTVASSCGAFTPMGQSANGTTVTYTVSFTAPNEVQWSENPIVTITAKSTASLTAPPVQSASANVNVIPVPYISFVPFAPSALPVSDPSSPVLVNLIAVSANDATNQGVNWAVCANASICGQFLKSPAVPATLTSAAISAVFSPTLHAASGQIVSYQPPTSVPTSGTTTITVTSTANPSVKTVSTIAITPNLTGVAVKGVVRAGSLPVSKASVQLYQAGNTGYGSAAFPLVISGGGDSVSTDQNGNFSIPAGYRCSSQNSLLYLIATGGTVSGQTSPNSELGLMSALGACGNLSSSVTLVVNEVTTVASAWALARFTGTGGTSFQNYAYIGSSSSNYSNGLANAFAAVNNLVDITTGQARRYTPAGGAFTPPGPVGTGQVLNGIVPQAEINTLADVIDSCAATKGGMPGDGSPCDNFFYASNVNPIGGNPSRSNEPASILQAVLEVALYPARTSQTGPMFPTSGTALYALLPAQGNPFTPVLAAAPSDWSIALSFSGGGLEGARQAGAGSTAMAIDGAGNLWIANPRISSVSELTNLGVPLSPFAKGYTSATGGGFTGGGLNSPRRIAIDPNGSVWALNGNNSLTELDFTGTPVTCGSTSPNPFCAGSNLSSPFSGAGNANSSAAGLAIDSSGNVWVAESGTPGDVAEYAGFNGAVINGKQVLNGGAISPAGRGYTTLTSAADPRDTASANPNGAISIDGSGNVWILDQGNYTAVELTSNGSLRQIDHGYTIDPSTGKPSGSILTSSSFGGTMAIDGNGQVFIPDMTTGQQVYELFACGSASDPNCLGIGKSVFGNQVIPGLNPPIAIDGSQNIWFMAQAYPAYGIPGAAVEFNNSGTPLNQNASVPTGYGYVDPPFTDYTPQGVAVDASGNLWVLFNGAGQPITVTEFVGVATPVVTPLSLGKLGKMP